MFADTSDVTLTTGDPRAELSATIQQGPGHPPRQKNIVLFQWVVEAADKLRSMIATPFSARRQDLPSWTRSKMGIG
jgi:hypothetical protein